MSEVAPSSEPGRSTASPDDAAQSPRKEQNAFTALMARNSPKRHDQDQQNQQQQRREQTDPSPSRRKPPNVFKDRDGLGAYLSRPESFHSSVVAHYTDDFVAVNDLFPKSSVHILLLPRDPARFYQHPFDALSDPAFLARVRAEAEKLRKQVASELRRRFGKFSASEGGRIEAMEADPPPDELPVGRDWEAEVMCGIHAHPSMSHLHIHIISKDRHSERMRHRKHYNSFATPFFVPLADFPLTEDDVRRHPGREGYLKRDLVCWRCGANFGNKFTKLKAHLDEEFEEWKHL